ncbi:MAG TPA: hypothetical protein ENN87_02295 [Phycisphaerales bacterium]|nr:hypothetical protein [Phycisphaerales bacterium]
MSDGRQNRRAVALIAVMWVLVLLAVMVTVATQETYMDTRISMSASDRIRCKWAARAGLERAIAVLESDLRDSDSLYDPWSAYMAVADFNNIVLDGCRFSVSVTDEAGKLNINTITREQLLWLPDMTEEIADAILDWRDSDDEARELGVETPYYVNLERGYPARNGDFRTIRELLQVRGVTQALLYGRGGGAEAISDYNQGWIRYLTCYSYDLNVDADGNPRIDINRANERQLQEELGISAAQARWIAQNRRYDSIADLLDKATSAAQGDEQSEPITEQVFYDIADKITTTRRSRIRGRVNVNTAPAWVLTALLGGNEPVAQDIVAYREGLAGGITTLADLRNVPSVTLDLAKEFVNYVTTRSNVYTVHVVATGDRSGLSYEVEAVVDRGESPTQILYFREGAIY